MSIDGDVPGLTRELAEALRLTQEYVGDELLPPRPGWSWFDALDAFYRKSGTPGGYWEVRALGALREGPAATDPELRAARDSAERRVDRAWAESAATTEWKVTLHPQTWTIQEMPDGPLTAVLSGQVMVIDTGGPAPWRAGMMAAVMAEDAPEQRPARRKRK